MGKRIDEIYSNLGKVSPEDEAYLRDRMSRIKCYKNLEPHIEWFEVRPSYNVMYNRYYNLVYAMKQGKPNGIPIPKNRLRGNPSSKTKLLKRLRKQIADQIKPLAKPGFHVDHIYPFEKLVEDWLSESGLTYTTVKTTHYPSWRAYHRKNATFQYLTPEENMAKGNKVL